MWIPRQHPRAPIPVVARFAASPRTEWPDLDAFWSPLRPLACDLNEVFFTDFGGRQTLPFVERVLSSLPRVTRVRISSPRLASSSIAAPIFEHVAAFRYCMHPTDTPSDSSGLFRILHSMPNLQDLTMIQVAAELQASVSQPSFSLRSYTYHNPFVTGPHWHLPIINSSGTLRRLSLVFTTAPPADSLLAAAQIIGPSLESLSLHANGHVVAIAEVLFPRLMRLRDLTIWSVVTSEEALKLMHMLGSGAPLRRLSITMSLALVDMLRCALETAIPQVLRALRELCPRALYPDVADSDQLLMLLRVCARRKVRFDTSRLPVD